VVRWGRSISLQANEGPAARGGAGYRREGETSGRVTKGFKVTAVGGVRLAKEFSAD
jgi:hypothetical protein